MPNSLPAPWTRARRCNVCGKADCLYAGPLDAPSAVICRNRESAVTVGTAGWLHELRTDGPTWTKWRLSLPKLARGTHADA
jgi:hypothetical protein